MELSYHNRRKASTGDAILSSTLIRRIYIDQSEEAHAWDLYLKHQDLALSFTDATSFAVMETFGLTEALTFDQDFSKAGFKVLPTSQLPAGRPGGRSSLPPPARSEA